MGVKVFCRGCGKANERDTERCTQCGKLLAEGQTKVMKPVENLPPPKGLEKGGSTSFKPSSARPAYVKCPQCSHISKGTSRFCNKCGAKLENAAAADSPSPAPVPAPSALPGGEQSAEGASPAAPAAQGPSPHIEGEAPPAPGNAPPPPAVAPHAPLNAVHPPAAAAGPGPARRMTPGFTAKIDRTHRRTAMICDECGVLNVGYEQCVDCGADLKKPGPEKAAQAASR